jgi:hypothetical protein
MIYKAEDKSNARLDRRRMGPFFCLLNDMVLKEIHLNGGLYTRSNERAHPTLERIDHAFITSDWEDIFPRCDLHALSSYCSDHTPLLLRLDVEPTRKRWFIFQAFWTKCAGFLDVVERA